MNAALEGGEWSAARPGRTLPPGKTRYPFYRRLGGPQDRSGRAENLVPTGIRSRTVQPVVSRYTDWAALPNTHTHTYTHIPNILTINRNNFSKKHLPFDLFNWFNFNWSWTRELYLILVLHLPRHTAIAAVLRDTIKGTLHIIVANLTANNCDVAN